jgi:Na+/melibiose symporter-like transporter
VATGQRSEGLLFAANGLISKCLTGVGTFLSGLILAWVSFPQQATPGKVDPAILHHLGMVFVPIVATFSAIAIAVLMFYDIDRSKHQKNIEQLESAVDPDSDAGGIVNFPQRSANRAL